MMAFVLGAAVGYVLGARAGRERYEQIARTYHRVAEHPTVQSAAGTARQKVSGAVTSRFRQSRNGRRVAGRPATTPPASTPPATTPAATTPPVTATTTLP